MLDSVQRVTGTTDEDWVIRYETSAARYRDAVAEWQQGQVFGLIRAMYTRTFFPGGGGEFESKRTAKKVLGLPEEDLDDATRRAVELVASEYGHSGK